MSSKSKSSRGRVPEKNPHEVRDMKAERLAYFHHRIHRVDLEPLLRRNGDFMLRRIRQGTIEKYAISVKWGDSIRHFPISRSHRRWCFEDRKCDTIRRLIEFHVNTGTSLSYDSGVRIERPIERQWWELLSKDIEQGKFLGKGNFGSVYKAVVAGREVAMKTLDRVSQQSEDKIEAARVEMLEEARIMRAVTGHENVIEALGVTIDIELPWAIMEIVAGNSLEKKLRAEQLPMDLRLRLVGEAAAAVGHIHGKGYLHRDLATRNCLLEKDEKAPCGVGRLKLTDFGMAKFVGTEPNAMFKRGKQLQMPVRWSAIESLEKYEWTAKSDIWSLAVLAWETFTDAELPYTEVTELPLVDAVPMLKNGKRLEIPAEVPKAVAEMVQKCWDLDPAKRPTAEQLRDVCNRSIGKK